jgi:hypothetical protein
MKTSILMLYLRIMGDSRPKLRIGVYVVIPVAFAIAIGCMIDLLKFCKPTLKIFHPDIPGTCDIDPNLFFAQALLTVITDLCILIPLIPIIWKLPYTSHRKIGVSLILSLGLLYV